MALVVLLLCVTPGTFFEIGIMLCGSEPSTQEPCLNSQSTLENTMHRRIREMASKIEYMDEEIKVQAVETWVV